MVVWRHRPGVPAQVQDGVCCVDVFNIPVLQVWRGRSIDRFHLSRGTRRGIEGSSYFGRTRMGAGWILETIGPEDIFLWLFWRRSQAAGASVSRAGQPG